MEYIRNEPNAVVPQRVGSRWQYHSLMSDSLQPAREALAAGHSEIAAQLLEIRVKAAPAEAEAWQLLGFAYGRAQRIPEAERALATAVALNPNSPILALGHARAGLDAGLPAVSLFDRALRLAPGNLAAVAGLAAALGADGRPDAAENLLAETLLRHPDWLAGHKQLADLRWTSGASDRFDRSYPPACTAQPQNLQLRLAWFGAVAKTRDWEAALKIVSDGEALIGSRPGFAAARTFIAGESGDAALAARLFAQAEPLHDPVLAIAHIRHCLRTSQWDKAEAIALTLVNGNTAHMTWPYLSLIWRLRGDARAQWLDGHPPYIRTFDLNLSAGELHALAACLRRLHRSREPYLEQSVRGGTQTDTDRQLFFRAEPEIQRLRARVCDAIREYIDGLPAQVPGHPLLGKPRGRILFSGSWSVLLRGHGFHVSHTHPMGWISSALYVSLPEPDKSGAAPAGWIRFGSPPPELGLTLPAYGQIQPKAGLLVLFPSTLWHETLPFDDGERLVVAFDVMRLNASEPPSPR